MSSVGIEVITNPAAVTKGGLHLGRKRRMLSETDGSFVGRVA
jgi:hypothetical protein